MGLALGGRMHQQIYESAFDLGNWDTAAGERCFVAILNSADWHAVTGRHAPTKPVTADDYASAGLPWFDYYADAPIVDGAQILNGLKSVAEISSANGDGLAADFGQSVPVTKVVKLSPGRLRGVRPVQTDSF